MEANHGRNTELFDRIADRIEREPATYNQLFWGSAIGQPRELPEIGCGTAYCVAGHAVSMAGGCTPRSHPSERDPKVTVVDWGTVTLDPGHPLLAQTADFGNGVRSTPHVAAKLLGLSAEDAEILFRALWKPPYGESVPHALRRIGRGGNVCSWAVTQEEIDTEIHACTPDPVVQAAQNAQQLGGN